MTFLIILAIYLVASGFSSRKILQVILERPVCDVHQEGWYTGRCSNRHYGRNNDWVKPTQKPLGEVVNRPFGLVLLAATMGLLWPIFILPLITMSAKPTDGELRRRNEELEANIRKLEAKIK